ncbi:secondary thiamine-phosphate synthase enzyme YjbQ [Alphaproteobacteria bacterium]|nr:secondary thiamine-phosphate synthase enzyme YjbQ [Alphaproteobacteria bacterium]
MKNILETLAYPVSGKGMYEITSDIRKWGDKHKIDTGHLNLFIQHTSASLIIMENASPDVLEDINSFFLKLVPENSSLYKHGYEGDDDMPAHIKYMLTQTSLTIPVSKGKMILGTWQGIYLFEHRYQAKERRITLSFIGN